MECKGWQHSLLWKQGGDSLLAFPKISSFFLDSLSRFLGITNAVFMSGSLNSLPKPYPSPFPPPPSTAAPLAETALPTSLRGARSGGFQRSRRDGRNASGSEYLFLFCTFTLSRWAFSSLHWLVCNYHHNRPAVLTGFAFSPRALPFSFEKQQAVKRFSSPASLKATPWLPCLQQPVLAFKLRFIDGNEWLQLTLAAALNFQVCCVAASPASPYPVP